MSRTIASVWYELSGLEIRLIEELNFLQGSRNYCFPGREYLAAKLKVSTRTISRHTHKLQVLGLLRIQPRRYKRRNGTWLTRSNLYQVLGFLGQKMRQILGLLAGGTMRSRTPKPKEKSLSSDLSHVKNSEMRAFLERWKKRGESDG